MRREFPKPVKREAAARSQGRCEAVWDGVRCDTKLPSGGFHYDHDLPDWMGGEPTLENCRVLCLKCHRQKTTWQDQPAIARAKRIQDREIGIRRGTGRGLPGGRKSPFKLKMDGTVVDRKTGKPWRGGFSK
jgi:5-methylcytosine-specific restriction enzyme A